MHICSREISLCVFADFCVHFCMLVQDGFSDSCFRDPILRLQCWICGLHTPMPLHLPLSYHSGNRIQGLKEEYNMCVKEEYNMCVWPMWQCLVRDLCHELMWPSLTPAARICSPDPIPHLSLPSPAVLESPELAKAQSSFSSLSEVPVGRRDGPGVLGRGGRNTHSPSFDPTGIGKKTKAVREQEIPVALQLVGGWGCSEPEPGRSFVHSTTNLAACAAGTQVKAEFCLTWKQQQKKKEKHADNSCH